MPEDILNTDAWERAPGSRSFAYRGIRFTLSVQAHGTGLFMPRVLYLTGLPDTEQTLLPEDSDPYAWAAEAWRHAEQQAVRWANDRSGDGQGQF